MSKSKKQTLKVKPEKKTKSAITPPKKVIPKKYSEDDDDLDVDMDEDIDPDFVKGFDIDEEDDEDDEDDDF